MIRAAVSAITMALAAPGTGWAHAVFSLGGGALFYRSEHAGSASRLEIRSTLACVTAFVPGTFGGMQAPISCQPGRTDANGSPVEFTCPATRIRPRA